MIVACPSCASRYQLPETLIGERGARVRCRGCGEKFEVIRDEAGGEPGLGSAPAVRQAPPTSAPGPEPMGDEAEIARWSLEELAAHQGLIQDAVLRGRLFAEAGPWLLEAFDRYRSRAGSFASVQVFRAALRERWGIDLPARE